MKNKIILMLLLLSSVYAFAQTPTCYRIYLHDKNNTNYNVHLPHQFLSQRALAKRAKFAIPITEEDLPISQQYVNAILSLDDNIRVLTQSKWMNTVVVYCPNNNIVSTFSTLPFVDSILPVACYVLNNANIVNSNENEYFDNSIVSALQTRDYNYGSSIEQIGVHNGQLLHQAGFQGDSMLIAILDGGWEGFSDSPYFTHLYQNGQIWGVRDLIPDVNNIYTGHTHGTCVTSIIGAKSEGELIGTAPNANFFFIRSENPWSEQLIEEDFWTAGAELADSLGADVINSSLGYTTFADFPYADFYVSQSDGVTGISSRAATIATEKGIVVVISAGNEGESEWGYISRPSDAFNVLCVGAVSKDTMIASFSSHGFSADGRVKPDVVSVGWNTWVVYPNSEGDDYVAQGNGTSFSGPVITGMAACLWQSLPNKTATEIMQIIREHGHQFNNPDSIMGYGVPDFYQAYLDNRDVDTVGITHYELPILGYPNPCIDNFTIVNANYDIVQVEFYDMTGRRLFYHNPDQSYYLYFNLSNFPSGIYFAKIIRKNQINSIKIIKK